MRDRGEGGGELGRENERGENEQGGTSVCWSGKKTHRLEVSHAEWIGKCGSDLNIFMFDARHCVPQITQLTALLWSSGGPGASGFCYCVQPFSGMLRPSSLNRGPVPLVILSGCEPVWGPAPLAHQEVHATRSPWGARGWCGSGVQFIKRAPRVGSHFYGMYFDVFCLCAKTLPKK